MLTIFSTARRFEGIFGVIQRNALTSWTQLEPRPQIILFGDDAGTAEICAELGLTHVPDVETSDLGTPLVSDMFAQAQRLAIFDTCCFVNSDIVLFQELEQVVDAARARFGRRYLVVGQRHDVDVPEELAFAPGWQDALQREARRDGKLRSEIFLDYFIFPTGEFDELPPFAIGRSAYDNWLVWHAGDTGAAVIDATPFMMIVHQNHDYSHAGGMKAVWEGPEAQRAHEMIGHWSRYHAVAHARHMFTPTGEIVRARGLKYRLARPRRVASHLLRFTRPWRRQLNEWRRDWRTELRSHASARIPVPMAVSQSVARVARIPARTRQVRTPDYEFGQILDPRWARLRMALWAVGRFLVLERPVDMRWTDNTRIGCWLGNDISRCLYVGGAFEPNELAFWADVCLPGMMVVDAGANEGLYTVLAARQVGTGGSVLAIEPSSRERARLEANVALNHFSNVTVAAEALADEIGSSLLHLADAHHAGQNTFGGFVHAGVDTAGDEVVPTTTLDELVDRQGWTAVDLIKADVEGAEVRLLDGARGVIAGSRPIILLEWQDDSLRRQGSSIDELASRLASLDYVVLPFDASSGRPTVKREATQDDANVVACPNERLIWLTGLGVLSDDGPMDGLTPHTQGDR